MPIPSQNIGATAPKSGTYQYTAKRVQGLTLKIPVAAGVSSVPNRRIVSIQQNNTTKALYAVVSPVAISSHTIVGWGVLEEALQSGGISSIAPTPNTFVDGDTVTVLRDPQDVYAVDYDTSNAPTEGIGTAYLDVQGRLTSVSSGSNIALSGAVFEGVPGAQLTSQLASGALFYQMYTSLKP